MVVDNKRKAEESALVPVGKKAKNDVALSNKNKQLTQLNPVRSHWELYEFLEYNVLCLQAPARTSNLFAPIMVCEGHEGEIFTVDFHPEGQYFATSGFDRKIRKYFGLVYVENFNLGNSINHIRCLKRFCFQFCGMCMVSVKTCLWWRAILGQ